MLSDSEDDSSRASHEQSTAEKLQQLLSLEFGGLTSPDEASPSSLEKLNKYANRLALEKGVSVNRPPAKIDRENVLVYSLLLLVRAQQSLLDSNPIIQQSNQLAIDNIAQAFGVPKADDSEALLESIGYKFGVLDYENVGDVIKERLLCVPRLLQKFGLDKKDPKLLFNADKLYEAIHRRCEDNSFLDRMNEFLDMPFGTTEETIFNYLEKKLEVEDQTEMIVQLKKQNRELRDSLNSMKESSLLDDNKEKSIEETKKFFQAEKELSERKNTVLQIRVNTLEAEIENLKAQLDKKEKVPKYVLQEIETLKQINQLLENQFCNQIQELKNGSDNRSQLIRVIQRQGQIINAYDKLANENVQKSSGQFRSITSPAIDNKIYNLICSSIENAPPDIVDDVLFILQDSHLTKQEKITHIIYYFIDKIRKQKKLIETKGSSKGNERLVNAMHSQLHFLENLLNCDEDIQFLFSDPEEARKSLEHQAEQLTAFLNENAQGFVEDANIFDSIQLNEDPVKMSEHLMKFFEQYPEIKTEEGEELFALLRQAFAVNSILRRFALTTRNQCEKQSTDIKLLVSEFKRAQESKANAISNLQRKFENECNLRTRAETTIKKLKSLIKSNAEIAQKEAIARTDPDLQSTQVTDNEQRIDSEVAPQDLTVPISPRSIGSSIQNQMTQQSSQTSPQKQNGLEQVSIDKFNSLKSEFDQLNEELNSAKDENASLKSQIEDLNAKHSEKVRELSKSLSELQNDIDNKKYDPSELQIERKKSELLKQKNNKLQLKHQNDKDKVSELNSKVKALETIRTKLTENAEKEKEKNKHLEQQLRMAQNDLLSKEYDEKLTDQRIKSLQKEIERERQSFESILSLHKTSSQSEISNAVDNVKAEMIRNKQEFLTKIASELSQYLNFSKPIDEDSILDIIGQLKNDLSRFQQDADSAQQQLDEVRSAFKLKGHVDMVSFANDTAKKIEDTTNQLNSLQDQINNIENSPAMKNSQIAKDWEEWARRIYLYVVDNSSSVASASAVRKGIEEAIMKVSSEYNYTPRKPTGHQGSTNLSTNFVSAPQNPSNQNKANISNRTESFLRDFVNPKGPLNDDNLTNSSSMNANNEITPISIKDLRQRLKDNKNLNANIDAKTDNKKDNKLDNKPYNKKKVPEFEESDILTKKFTIRKDDDKEINILSDSDDHVPIFNNFASE